MKLKDICSIQDILFWKYVKLFGQVFGPPIWIPEYYSGAKKTWNLNTEYYSVLGKSEYRIQILLFGPIIRIVFEYRIIRHTLGGGEDQWEAWNWSCDLRANARPRKKMHPMAHNYKRTDMTELAKWGRFSENLNYPLILNSFSNFVCV